MTNRLHGAIGIGLALGLGLSACSSSHRGAGAPTTTSSTTTALATASTSTTSAVVSSSTTTTAAATSTTAATTPSGPGTCPTSALKGSLTGADGTAGSIYYQLVLTNTSSASCVVEGYPGVSFVYGNQGQQVGAAAAHITGSIQPVMLAPGATAAATLQITEAGNYGQCGLTATDGLRVYPPNQTQALLVLHNDQACSDTNDVTLHVGPFHS